MSPNNGLFVLQKVKIVNLQSSSQLMKGIEISAISKFGQDTMKRLSAPI